MSALHDARERILSEHAAYANTRNDTFSALRSDAIAAFSETGFPTTRHEDWRYTNVTSLAKAVTPPAGVPVPALEHSDLEAHAFPTLACSTYVFVNGRFAQELSASEQSADGTRVSSLAQSSAPKTLGALIDVKEHPFAAWNTAFLDDGAHIHVPRGVRCGTPIHLVFLSSAGETADHVVHPRVFVHAEPGSHVQVLQDHVVVGDATGITNPVTEIDVEDDASVDYIVLQREPDHRFHVSNLAVRQARSSRVSAHTLCLGGKIVRNDARVTLAGEGAECDLRGLFIGGGDQLIDNHTWVDHAVPHCTSREVYKGILGGTARGVFRGRVVVRPDAQKTSAFQSNPNLLIGRKAEIDTKPQLEIYADDVKCNHGSTIGQLDDKKLFYLRSRGIEEAKARDMLTHAFGYEILNSLPLAGLREAIDEYLFERLRHARRGDSA